MTPMYNEQLMPSPTTIVGHFDLLPPALPAEGELNITVKPADMLTFWNRCSLISNFVGDFYKTNGRLYNVDANLISTVFNELLENAVKYSKRREAEIAINVKLYDTIFKMTFENHTSEQAALPFMQYLSDLYQHQDLEGLYLEKMEKKALGSTDSGFGLLLLLKDYPIRIGGKFETTPQGIHVTIQAYYDLDA